MTLHAVGRAFVALIYAGIGVFLGFLVGLAGAIAVGALWPRAPFVVTVNHWLPVVAAVGVGLSFVALYFRSTRGGSAL